MVSEETLSHMVVSATELGWTSPDWPASFERDGKVWTVDHLTVAQKTGEVQCAEYQAADGSWIIVYNE